MLFFRAHRTGHGDGRRDSADRAACAERCRKAGVKTEFPRHEENDGKSNDGNDGCLEDGDRSRPDDERERQSRTQQHDAELDIEFDAKTRIQPAWKATHIRDDEAKKEPEQWWL